MIEKLTEQRQRLIAAMTAKGLEKPDAIAMQDQSFGVLVKHGAATKYFRSDDPFAEAHAWVDSLPDRNAALMARHKALLEEAIQVAEEADMAEGRIAALRLLADGVPA